MFSGPFLSTRPARVLQQRPDASQKARYLKKAMHKQSAMHPIFMKSQIKRCIQFAKCISIESFSPKSDASIPPNASQSITYLKKEMHASRIMHRNQHNIPKIRCIRRTNTQQKGPSHQVRQPLKSSLLSLIRDRICSSLRHPAHGR